MLQYPIGGGVKVVNYHGCMRLGSLRQFGFLAVTRTYEQSPFHARIPATFEIDPFVTNYERFSKLDAEFVPGVEQELGGWLAPFAGLIRGFGSDIDLAEIYALPAEFSEEMPMDVLDIDHGEKTPADSGLIGNDKDLKISVLECAQGLPDTGQDDYIFGSAKVVPFLVQGSVPVKKNGFVHALLSIVGVTRVAGKTVRTRRGVVRVRARGMTANR
jgi:hypothetical protein